MFVRWKRQERQGRVRGGQLEERALLTAVLVRSERREGKPRQKIVAYLGCITLEGVTRVWPRRHFWRRMDDRLSALGLDAAMRGKIEASLIAVVARPTAEEIEATDREYTAAWQLARTWLKGR